MSQTIESQPRVAQPVSQAVLRRRELTRARYARARRNTSMINPNREPFSLDRLYEIMIDIQAYDN